jgi:CBS domain-containing protein
LREASLVADAIFATLVPSHNAGEIAAEEGTRMDVKELLKKKGGEKLFTTQPDHLVSTVAATLAKNRIGALPVCDAEGKLVGIISERDLIRGVAEVGPEVLSHPVSALMTRDVYVCKPTDSLRETMHKMSLHHVRHLPVIDGNALVGILSQRDAMKSQLEMAQMETNVLRDYARARP